ncbi:Nuclease-related domain-containing protein [Mesobacillus persicus]|uniref:Nuclease-related domain-containing protein n=1 Tax=Mesobacillus persicus TaxID=930146 RepID=A0A1H7XL42_9BACI|nr:Nuclease-related domain-containing protein [Mesobacillus persicus]
MIVKSRQVSGELKLMRILNARMELEDKDKQNYFNLEKGFEGELKFDALMTNLQQERLILNDLLLEKNTTKFQIDSFHIAQATVYHFEVKNFEGDYYIEKDRFFTYSGKEVLNPLHQLRRSETLLRQVFQNSGFSFPIESYLIFVNPSFTLYQAPKDPYIIFPTQLDRFLLKMNRAPSSNLNTRHTKLAEKLLALHQIDDPYKRLPLYSFEGVRKGVMCGSCYSFDVSVGEYYTICNDCKCTEESDNAILRSISEFQLLFPERKITTSIIYDWCEVIKSVKTIRRNLAKNFKQIGYGKWVYYENRN